MGRRHIADEESVETFDLLNSPDVRSFHGVLDVDTDADADVDVVEDVVVLLSSSY